MKTQLINFIYDYKFWLPWVALSIFLFLHFIYIHKKFKENAVWSTVMRHYQNSLESRLDDEAIFVSQFGNIENNSLFYKIDRLILTSGIEKYLPWFTGEVFLVIEIILGVSGFIIGIATIRNFYWALFIGISLIVFLYVVVLGLSSSTYNAIEDSTSIFVSILSNHAKGSSDIVTIMENTYPSLDNPLKGIVRQFIIDAGRTGNIDIAFDYMKESVDNRELRTIIINLKNCMHYQANYEEVLAQMMGQIAAGLTAREERKNILFSMKITLVIISIASAVIVLLIGKGIDIDVLHILRSTQIGQFLLFLTGLMYLFVTVKLFVTDK